MCVCVCEWQSVTMDRHLYGLALVIEYVGLLGVGPGVFCDAFYEVSRTPRPRFAPPRPRSLQKSTAARPGHDRRDR